MVIPRSLRDEAGILEGTLMKIAVIKGGQFLLTPQITIDLSVISDHQNKNRKQSLREFGRGCGRTTAGSQGKRHGQDAQARNQRCRDRRQGRSKEER